MKVSLQEACRLLQSSSIVAIPTETVWGLAARYDDMIAIEKIYEAKRRPKQNPLIIHVEAFNDVVSLAKMPLPPKMEELAARFWPGPLTLVIPVDENKVPNSVRSNLPSAAFRVPDHEGARALIRAVGPLVAPSANLSGKPSATEYTAVEADFGADFPCYISSKEDESILPLHGVESTILVWTDSGDGTHFGWAIGRLGSLSLHDISAVLGDLLIERSHEVVETEKKEKKPICPGQMFRHYAPEARLDVGYTNEDIISSDTVIGFSDRIYPVASRVFPLGTSYDARACLRNLYKILRSLDENKISEAWVDARITPEDLQRDPLWRVFIDRIEKAAHKE